MAEVGLVLIPAFLVFCVYMLVKVLQTVVRIYVYIWRCIVPVKSTNEPELLSIPLKSSNEDEMTSAEVLVPEGISTDESPSKASDSSKQESTIRIEALDESELTPLEDITASKALVIEAFSSEDWAEQHQATTIIRRLIRFNDLEISSSGKSDFVCDSLDLVLSLLAVGVGSLRSAATKNALFAIKELFQHLKDAQYGKRALEEVNPLRIEDIVDAVVLKTVSDKRFIATAGISVVEHIVSTAPSFSVLLPLLRHGKNKNAKLNAVIARNGYQCLKEILSSSGKHDFSSNSQIWRRLVAGFIDLSNSRSADARKCAQKALCTLHSATSDKAFEEALKPLMTKTEAAQILRMVSGNDENRSMQRRPSMKEAMARKRRQMSNIKNSFESSGIVLV